MDKIVDLLSDSEKIGIVMQNITSYVVYIYPGIISIYLYNFLLARTTKDTKEFLIKSFTISYLYNLFIQMIFSYMWFLKEKPDKNSISYNIVLIIASFLFPYCFHKFNMSKLFALICKWLKISTSITDVPFELLGDNDENYTCLKIYLKNEPCAYIGYLAEYEYEDGHEKYVILTGYRQYYIENISEEKLIVSHKAEEYNEKVLIRFDDIKRIEKIGELRAKEKIYNEK